MKLPFMIFIKAVGIYALLTLFMITVPIMYFFSLGYVLTFGWFAWFLFTLIYVTANNFRLGYSVNFLLLFIGVPGSVAFAYNMIGVFGAERDVWHSEFLFLPLLAVIAGWISLYVSRRKIGRGSGTSEVRTINY